MENSPISSLGLGDAAPASIGTEYRVLESHLFLKPAHGHSIRSPS